MKVKVRVEYERYSRDTILDWRTGEQVFTIPSRDRPVKIVIDPDNDILMSKGMVSGVYDDDEAMVYPVPFTDRLYIDVPDHLSANQITITDLAGRRIYQQPVIGIHNEIETSSYLPGNYLISITGNNFRQTRVIVKK
jgi:hypothetical protein